jgi:hypothetical protein
MSPAGPVELPDDGPHLAVAVLCADGGFDSSGHLRIDTVITRAAVDEPMPQHGIDAWFAATLIVAFRAGGARGTRRLAVTVSNELSQVADTGYWNLTFDYPEQVVGIAGPVTIAVPRLGLYWWDVTLDGQPVTRIPLEVVAGRGSGSRWSMPGAKVPVS